MLGIIIIANHICVSVETGNLVVLGGTKKGTSKGNSKEQQEEYQKKHGENIGENTGRINRIR